MKRDLDYIRKILLKCEEDTTGEMKCELFVDDDHDINSAAFHCNLLADVGYIQYIPVTSMSFKFQHMIILRLTAAGCDYLDSIRNDKIWNQVKSKIADLSTSLPFDIIKKLALTFISAKLEI